MKITDIRSYGLVDELWNPWFFVRVDTDEGIYGVGEGGGLWAGDNMQARHTHTEKFKEWFVGYDPLNVNKLINDAQQAQWGLSRLNLILLSGIEMACWDIKGKHYGVPVHELLGGKLRDRIKIYAKGWSSGIEEPEEWAARAQEVTEQGFTGMKLEPFGDPFRIISSKNLHRAEAIVKAIREAVGPDIDLIIEGHARFTIAEAIKIGRVLEPYEPTWFEAPVRATLGSEGYKEVRQRLNIPISSDFAGIEHRFAALDFIRSQAIDIIQPSPTNCGGIWETMKIGYQADAAEIMFCPHHAEGPISFAAAVHISSVLPNFLQLEYFETFAFPKWTFDVCETKVRRDGAEIIVPDAPGLGVDFDEEEAQKHLGNPKPDHNLYKPGWRDTYSK